jgi:hypothetical protein
MQGRHVTLLSAIILASTLGLVGCSSDQLTSWSAVVEGAEGKLGGGRGEPSVEELEVSDPGVSAAHQGSPDMSAVLRAGEAAQCPSCLARSTLSQDAGATNTFKCTACGALFTLTPTDTKTVDSEETDKPQEPESSP